MNNEVSQHSVAEAVKSADERINRSVDDVSEMQERAIKLEEEKVIQMLSDYQRMNIYESVVSDFTEVQLSDEDTPENILKQLAENFDLMRAEENSRTTEVLQTRAHETIQTLQTLKEELAVAASTTARTEIKVEESYQENLPGYESDPVYVADGLKEIGDRLGDQVNLRKFEGFEAENNDLLAEIRLSKNAPIYLRAQQDFHFAAGMSFENVPEKVRSSLDHVRQLVADGVPNVKYEFRTARAAILQLYELTNRILSNALFNPNYVGGRGYERYVERDAHEMDEAHEAAFTEQEMEIMLEIMVKGTGNEDFLGQILDPDTAYEYLIRKNPHDITESEKYALDVLRAGTSIITGTAHLALHPWETLKGLAKIGKGMFEPETWSKLNQMSQYTWEHTDMWEKSHFMVQLFSEFLIGCGVAKGAEKLLKSTKLGFIGEKMGAIGRTTGLSEGVVALALKANPILQRMPSLARYGTFAREITAGLVEQASMVLEKATHIIHKVETPISRMEMVERRTAKPVEYAEHARHTLEIDLPIYGEINTMSDDLALAMQEAEVLGLEKDEIVRIKLAAEKISQLSATMSNT